MEILLAVAGVTAVVLCVWMGSNVVVRKRLDIHKAGLVRELHASRDLATAFQYKFNKMRTLMDEMESRHTPLLDEVAILRAEVNAIEERKRCRADDHLTIQDRLVAAEEARDEAVEQCDSLTSALIDARRQLKSVETAHAADACKIGELQSANDQLTARATHAEIQTAALQLRLDKADAELVRVKEQFRTRIKSLKESVVRRDRDIRHLELAVAQLKSGNAFMQAAPGSFDGLADAPDLPHAAAPQTPSRHH